MTSRCRALLWTGVALILASALMATPADAQLVINEIDYDQSGTDAAEFVEILNVGVADENLDAYTLELVNGSNVTVYDTIDLPDVDLAPGDYFVVCGDAANVPECDLDDGPDTNFIQNGAPDAVALMLGATLIDTVSYEGDVPGFVEGSGAGLEDDPDEDFAGISRFPDGTDTDMNNVDLSFRCATPGAANSGDVTGCVSVKLVINEIDYDQPSGDTGEFVEILNVGAAGANLDACTVDLVDGDDGLVYQSIDLPDVDVLPGGYFVVCGDAVNVDNCDLDVTPDADLIQDGAPDAVALLCNSELMDTVSYEGDVPGFVEGSGAGLEDLTTEDLAGISRFPDGTDTDMNNVDLSFRCATPGLPNTDQDSGCVPQEQPELVINEIDYDQDGTDAAEFVEIANVGADPVNLDSFRLELVNGSGVTTYDTIDLPDVDLAPGDYFVVCGDTANVVNCDLDDDPDTNFIQNGAPDAVALFMGTLLVDTVSYEGDVPGFVEGSGSGLEDDSGIDFSGISRFPDGADTDMNNVDLSPRCITPGLANTDQDSDCPEPVDETPVLVINEIDYDQDGTDAAEFIELKNDGAVALELDPYAVELVNGSGGGATVYQTIDLPVFTLQPGDYFVICGDAANVLNCDLDVTPDTNLIQNGDPDAVGLTLDAQVVDAVSYEGDTGPPYTEGSGAGLEDDSGVAFAGISRSPDGADTDMNNVDLSPRCITPGLPNTDLLTNCTDMGPAFEIWELQGSGLTSPFEGQVVSSKDNVVTALDTNGFFMQTPEERVDGDPETSDGIFVFTNDPPTVTVGDRVDVTGPMVEFFELTEFGDEGLMVVVNSSGSPVPPPVQLDETVPSPDQPQPENELERFEGMLVTFDGLAVAGSDFFGDVAVVAKKERTFREPGIEFPGLPDLPVWDGNPEIFELDPDGLTLPDALLFGGQEVEATGPLTFSFGDYQVVPTTLTLGVEPEMPRPLRDRLPGELSVVTQNMLRLYDDVDDPDVDDTVLTTEEYQALLDKWTLQIVDVLKVPDVLAVQEVENLGVMQDLADRVFTATGVLYEANLLEGNDIGGIDVGYLTRADTILVLTVDQFGEDLIFDFDGSLLYDRPPLVLEAEHVGGTVTFPLTVVNVHQRSLSGIDDPSDGERVKMKRFDQAEELALFIQDLQTTDPTIHLLVTGDFNAFQFTDGFVDVLGMITGDPDPLGAELPAPDHVDPDLLNEILGLPAGEQYSFIFEGSAQTLDHALTSTELQPAVSGVEYARGNTDAPVAFEDDELTPLRSSDHDALALFLAPQGDIACAELLRFDTRCRADGKLQARVVLDSFAHDGGTVTFEVDGQAETVVINGRRAVFSMPNAGSGLHTIRLVHPGACFPEEVVECP